MSEPHRARPQIQFPVRPGRQRHGYPPANPVRRMPVDPRPATHRGALAEETAPAGLLRPRRRTDTVRPDSRAHVTEQFAARLVSPALWAVVEPLIPPVKVRRQGGGRGRVRDRTVFTAIVFVLASGCAWRHLPGSFGVTVPTAHRRFQEWTDAGLWLRVRRAAQHGLAGAWETDWIIAVLDAAERRTAKTAS